MPKVSIKNQVPKLDMNPMVDMAFLLVSFFMLTTTFKTEEPVEVTTPASQTEAKLPEKDIMTITVSEDGRVFFNIDNKFTRETLIKRMGQRFEFALTEQQARNFSLASSFGLPIGELSEWLSLSNVERKKYPMQGIPVDSTQNELKEWIIMSRAVNPRLRVSLNGDQHTPYPIIDRVMDILVDNNITRFSLVTEIE